MYSLISGYEQQQQKYRIQFTGLKKVNKLKGPSEDSSVPLGREKKLIISEEGVSVLRGKVDSRWLVRREPDLVLGEGNGLKP